MKTIQIIIVFLFAGFVAFSQDLPKDVEKVYKGAEHLKNKKEYQQAVKAYEEVLRSVNHVPSMVAIATIEMELMGHPNYRKAYEYYDKAIRELELQIGAAHKRKVKARLGQEIQRLTPKRNKAKSYVDDFDKTKNGMDRGHEMLKDEDLD